MGLCRCRVGIGDTCLAPVTDRSVETLLAIIKACILHSTTIVSDFWGTAFVSAMMDSPLRQSLCEFHGKWMLTNTIKPTSMHIEVNLGHYWENKFKCVINGFKGSLLAGFDDVAELIVKCCLLPFCWTINSIYVSNWIYSWCPKSNKNTDYLKNMQSVMQCVICCAQNIWNL